MIPESFADTLVEAARQLADDARGDRHATARRIHDSLARRRRVRVRVTKIIAAIMATLFGSTAFAWYAGWPPPWSARRAPAVTSAPATPRVASASPAAPLSPAPPPSPVPPPAPPPSPVPPPAPAPSPAALETPPVEAAPRVALSETIAAPAAAPPATPTSHTAELQPAAAPHRAVARSPTAPHPEARPTLEPAGSLSALPAEPWSPSPPPEPSTSSGPRVSAGRTSDRPLQQLPSSARELALYRTAHDAHFHGSDPATALAAWDAYLTAYPDGALAQEARYNRAVLLIKLERWSDAEAALAPFAGAPAGSYRQAEAVRMLDAIRHR
jgi:TolA-binding protein